jgi:hypothetical protein
MNVKLAVLLCGLLATPLIAPQSHAYDSEWPPAPDPHQLSIAPGPGLAAGKIDIAIPREFSDWMRHQHYVGWGTFALSYSIGDIEGPDDGDLDIVIYMAEEFVLAGRLDVDFSANTGTFIPLWAWKTPICPPTPPDNDDFTSDSRNVLIWDFDGDGSNEVAVIAPDSTYTVSNKNRAIYLFATDPAPPPPPYATGWSAPPPVQLAKSPAKSGANEDVIEIGNRLGLCKVRDTPYRQDIVTHNHNGSTWSIWSLQKSGSVWSFAKIYHRTWDGTAKCHEWNYVDTDGDGYDEFLYDGVLDFVDNVGGAATPTNGMSGVWRWRTGHKPPGSSEWEDHTDQMFCANFDPDNPGLEIMTVPQQPWTDWKGGSHPRGVTILWDLDGNILREAAASPFTHPQSIASGNLVRDSDSPGWEVLHTPKSWSNPTVRGETWLCGSYAEDVLLNTIAVDGCYWKTTAVNGQYPTRSTGPTYNFLQIDWDGDHASDEILNQCWNALIVWRMGKKGDWLPGPPPAGMPSQAQALQSWTENVGGSDTTLWWEFYQGYNGGHTGDWGWNNGGAGRYTHYYEKMAEAYGGGLCSVKGYDVGKDYREEVVAVIGGAPSTVMILHNPAALDNPAKYLSPMADRDYRQFRMEQTGGPFDYSTLAEIQIPTSAANWRQFD